MKISLNWLKDYIEIADSPENLSDILTDLGLEVEGVEKISSVQGGLEGVVVGHVIECGQHPNADRLSLTKVDIGKSEPIQIVCGAPNVAKGQKVPVALVGTTIHPVSGDPITLKRGKIRGEASEGMICAEDELGLGDDHDGIIVMSPDAKVGAGAAQYFNVETDVVYDIALTPNRSDATSHLGVARDLAAYYSYHTGQKVEVKYPDVSQLTPVMGQFPIKINVIDSEGCPRFSGLSVSEVSITPSPEWMQFRLKAVDVRPINNVVDITNYVLHEFGQPLHAYDQDKIANSEIRVQKLKEGSKFTTLDENERTLKSTDLMICDGQDKGLCIAGVFGGLTSGVNDATKNIFIEAAHFDAQTIRKTSMSHVLRTDAAKCFEKGSDPNITLDAAKRAALFLQEYAGAKVSSDFVDVYPNPIQPKQVTVRYEQINKLIGNDLDRDSVSRIFDALNMPIVSQNNQEVTVEIPTDKADVTREADVIEEILRIYGFNNIELNDRISTAVQPFDRPDKNMLRNFLANQLKGRGMNEMMGMSLINAKLYTGGLEYFSDQLVYVNNTANINLNAMRPEMMMSMLISLVYNQNRQQTNISLFEFGNSYQSVGDDFSETNYLSLIYSGLQQSESWIGGSQSHDFYSLKRAVHEILTQLGIERFQVEELDDSRFAFGLKIFRGNVILAKYGQVSDQALKISDAKGPVFYAELDMDQLLKSQKSNKTIISETSKFPSSRRDLAFIVDEGVGYADLIKVIKKSGGNNLQEVNLFDVYVDEKHIGKGKKSYAISMVFANKERSLKDKELDKIIKKSVDICGQQFGATLR